MKKLAFAFTLILAALALAACGGDDDETTAPAADNGAATEESGEAGGGGEGGTAAGTVELEAAPDESLAYTTDSASAEAGKVTLEFTNPQAISHDVAIEDPSGETIGKTDVITEGSDSAVVDLEPGEYTFYCTVPGHREAGMEGTLTVE